LNLSSWNKFIFMGTDARKPAPGAENEDMKIMNINQGVREPKDEDEAKGDSDDK